MNNNKTARFAILTTLALLAMAIPAQADDAPDAQACNPKDKLGPYVDCMAGQLGGTECQFPGLLVCATSSAYAAVGYCESDVPGAPLYPCWFASAQGMAYGALGLVTGTLSGNANGVPLADACVSPGVETTCHVSDSAWEYPGAAVAVTGSVTAAAPYGADSYPFAAAAAL
ncbi:MAG: hypothetical protein QOJ26_1255 [Thermoplasmata archaeon]|nr:hypothetical protein [Thermoplasmata archaeon]